MPSRFGIAWPLIPNRPEPSLPPNGSLATTEMIGKTVSHYRILEKLGEGGMGIVYLAEDTHLGRRVAVKFLASTQNHNYRARFLREARAVSTLSHQNIAVVHDYGETGDGEPFIVMEYVKGKTLSDLLNVSGLTLVRALEITEAIADALGAAHAQGIVHRDIKPSNVIVDEDGRVKVLDFGLVKQLHEDETQPSHPDAATLPALRTSSNVVVGTPLYLSPEQATGTRVDERSDIFALGALLYESLTGKPAFSGKSVIEIGAQIIHVTPPPPSSINPRVPAELDRITSKALEKKIEKRYQSAAEFLEDLRAARLSLSDTYHLTKRPQTYKGAHSSALKTFSDNMRRPRMSITVFVVGILLVGVAVWRIIIYFYRPVPFEKTRVTRLTSTGKASRATISPDGKYVVYVSEETGLPALWLLHVPTSTNTQIIPPGEGQYLGLTFSPDSNYLYYVLQQRDAGTLFRRPVFGNTPQKIIANINSPPSVSSDGASLAFIRERKEQQEYDLVVTNSDGSGERKLATRSQGEFFSLFGATAWSPDNKKIACAAGSFAGGLHMNLIEVRVDNGAEKKIVPQNWFQITRVRWQANGEGLIFAASDQPLSKFQIWYLSYPQGRVSRITNDFTDYESLSLTADSRTLVTVQADRFPNIWVMQNGETEQVKQITTGVGHTQNVSWTTEGKILFSSVTGGDLDVWVMEADGTRKVQLTANARANYHPVASPDGSYVVFSSNRNGSFNLWRMDSDGNNAKQLTNGAADVNPCFSPDGQWIVYESYSTSVSMLWKVKTDGGEPIQITNVDSRLPTISPDGKMIACRYRDQTDKAQKIALLDFGTGQVLRMLDLPIHYWQRLRWSPDGLNLTYVDVRDGIANIWSQPLSGGAPKQLTNFKNDLIFSYDWTRNGDRLVCERGIETNDVVMITDTVH
jgi:eukaryotic-like serine/threonine-protein kinase